MAARAERAGNEAAGTHRSGKRGSGWIASSAVVLVTLLGNALYLFGLRSSNPLLYHSGLGSPGANWTGAPFGANHYPHTIDPNDGWTTQALGQLAARDWIHGTIPLWNVHEGLGQPLAGEMQSAAFFLPFVLLQLLPNGVFVMHLVLEIVAGLAMLGLLRQLKLSWLAASVGGSLFALNGAFAVMHNAPFNPIAFLPLAIWGVEIVRGRVGQHRSGALGAGVIALALAWMLTAGFPETALLEGLLVLAWMLARLPRTYRRGTFVAWCAAGGVLGLCMSAPVLVALRDMLEIGFTAYHGDGSSAVWSYKLLRATGFAWPFGAGPFAMNPITGGLAGFVTLPAVFFALLGVASRAPRALRWLLGVTVVVLAANMFGFAPVNTLLNLIPGMTIVLIYKYGIALICFAVAALAAFGIDSVRVGQTGGRAVLVAALATFGYLVGAIVQLVVLDKLIHPVWTSVVTVWTVLCLVCAVVAARRPVETVTSRFVPATLAALLLVLDATGSYIAPQLNASERRPIDTGAVTFLQAELGQERFFSLGPIQPNYGSYWGISQLNVNDLPVPQKFADFVEKDLQPAAGTPGANASGWAFAEFLLAPLNFSPHDQQLLLVAYGQEQQVYREAAVKYLVASPGVVDPESARRYSLTKVYSSKKADVWLDTKAESALTARQGTCRTLTSTRNTATVTCDRATTLVRKQLAAPGWSASVNGKSAPVGQSANGLYQTVHVPAGVSTLTFVYRPRLWWWAVAACLLGLIATAVLCLRGISRAQSSGESIVLGRSPARGGGVERHSGEQGEVGV